TLEQLAKELLGGELVAATLYQNVEHVIVLIHRAPEIMALPINRQTLLLDSGVFGFHVAHASSLIVRAIETAGPPGRDRAKNRAIQPRQVHDPGIQEEPTCIVHLD